MIGNKERLIDNNKTVLSASSNNIINNTRNDSTQYDNDDNFIFYDSKRQFTEQIVFHAVLNKNNSYKVIVYVDKGASMDFVCVKIAESFEKFDNFSGLEGLKAINVSKRSDKGEVINISQNGSVENIMNNDVIYCDLISEEYWISTRINFIVDNERMNAISFEFKCRTDITVKKMNSILLKFGINYFIDQRHKEQDKYHYVLSKILFKLSNNQTRFDYDDTGEIDSVFQSKISEFFDYSSNITFTITFKSLESVLFNQLQINTQPLRTITHNRLNEFKEFISLESMKSHGAFLPEYKYILKFNDNIFNHSIYKRKNVSEMFYLYNTYNTLQNYIDRKELSKEKMIIIIPKLYESITYNDDNSNSIRMSKMSLDTTPHLKSKRSSSFLENSKNSIEVRYEEDNEMKNDSNTASENASTSLHFNNLRNTSRYGNLCKEFKKSYKEKKFLEYLSTNYPIRLNGDGIEKVLIPQFRKMKVISVDEDVPFMGDSLLEDTYHKDLSTQKLIKEIISFIVLVGIIIIIVIALIFILV